MRKFLKSLLFVLFFGFLVFTGVFSYSEISKTHAVDSDTSYTVNFYGSDNETVIYSLDVPAGQSLNDLNNFIISDNSSFSSGFDSFASQPASYWSQTNIIFGDYSGVDFSNNIEFSYMNFFQDVNISNLNEIFVVFKCSSLSDSGYINQVYGHSAVQVNGALHYYTKTYISRDFDFFVVRFSNLRAVDVDVGRFGIQFYGSNLDFHFDYFFITTDYNVSYFNSDYVKQLYFNSGGTVGDNFEWSESKTSSSRFDFSQPITRNTNLYGFNFNGEVFNYNGEIASDYSHLGNYAIKDVEFFDYQGAFLYHIVIDTADILNTTYYQFLVFDNIRSSTTLTAPVVDSIYFNLSNNSDFPNFFIYSEQRVSYDSSGADGAIVPEFEYDPNGSYEDIRFILNLKANRGVVHVWFSQLQFSPLSRTEFELIPNDDYMVSSRLYDNVDEVVDMSSDTNFSFDLSSEISPDSDSFFFEQLYYWFFEEDTTYFQIYLAENYEVDFKFYYYVDSRDEFTYYTTIGYDSGTDLHVKFNTVYYNYDSFVNFYFYDNYFFIHRPVQRVDNTLVIYNFDYYNLLYSLNGITYTLLDNGNLYNVNYSGSVPNKYFIYLYNEQVANTIFDEYISLYLKYKNNYLTVGSIYDPYSVSLGFDFNFSYYVQPLVSNNGVYSYTFEKPDYVDMPFSLSPFYIPVLEIAENIMIFLVFYCPLISDVITLLHFDLFFGSLISIFDFIFNSSIGYFFLGCLAFLIYWSLLKLLFPSFLSSSRSAGQTFVDSFVSAQDVLDTPYVGKRYKPYRRKSKLGSYDSLSRQQLRVISNYKYYGYSGKRNSRIRKRMVAWAKEKYKK